MGDGKIASLLTSLKLDEKPLNDQFMFVEELGNADGSFILSSMIKDQIEKNKNIIIILCHNSLGHFHSIGQKLKYNLMSLKEAGDVYVVDILEKIVDDNFLNIQEPLKGLYSDIKERINKWSSAKGVCVILENIGNLSLVNTKEVFTFINYIRSIVWEKNNSSVVCSIHNFPKSKDINELCKTIKHFADLTVILKDLETGRANDVTGHLIVKKREENYRRCTFEYQYQLLDKSFVVFVPGARNFVAG